MAATMQQVRLLQEPAYCRLKVDLTEKTEDALRQAKDDLLTFLKLEPIHQILMKESMLLDTVVKIRKAQLRREKSIQLLQRIRACLLRVALMKRIFTLGSDLLKDIRSYLSEKNQVYLPCRQTWIYFLYLVSKYYELMHRTMEYAVTTFQYISCFCSVRHLLPIGVTYLAVSGRVWQLSKALANKFSDSYNCFYSVQENMKAAMSEWSCPDLPTELLKTTDESCSEDYLVGNSDEYSEESEDEAENSELATVIAIEPLNSLPSSKSELCDSEEDIGLPVDEEDYQKDVKRKFESSETDHQPHKKKKKDSSQDKNIDRIKTKSLANTSDRDENEKQKNKKNKKKSSNSCASNGITKLCTQKTKEEKEKKKKKIEKVLGEDLNGCKDKLTEGLMKSKKKKGAENNLRSVLIEDLDTNEITGRENSKKKKSKKAIKKSLSKIKVVDSDVDRFEESAKVIKIKKKKQILVHLSKDVNTMEVNDKYKKSKEKKKLKNQKLIT